MTEWDVSIQGSGTAFVAQTQIFYHGDDFVEVVPVSADSLAACEEWRFVPPTGDWPESEDKLNRHQVLAIVAEPGSGRRTAALRLLRRLCEPSRIFDLEPVWSRPRSQLLPPVTRGNGYVLDMTEPTEEPIPDNFGAQLLEWACDNDIYLIVATTPSVWTGRWTEGIRPSVTLLGSPDARRLVEHELRAARVSDRVTVLDDSAMEPIWRSKPKVEDALRLARIIREAPEEQTDPGNIADEYGDWRSWIEINLPDDIGSRALFWSCAFCDGGQRKSILRMAENLRRALGERRTPADILADAPASKRLDSAKVERIGDRVRLSPAQHELPLAVRRYLWDEFEDQIEILTEWIVNEAGALPVDDSARVVDAVLDLVLQHRDDVMLRRLRDALVEEHHDLAVRALSTAALDPRFGTHVRGRLYTWLGRSPSQATIDVVAAVCGGPFGKERPTMALVRLRRAAQKSQTDSQALAEAFVSLARQHPRQVLTTIDRWLSEPSVTAGIKAFLALASHSAGAELLCGKVDEAGKPAPETLVRYFRAALSDPATREHASTVLETWQELAEQGALDTEATIEVAGAALAPWIKDNIMRRFLPPNGSLDMTSYWGRVLRYALQAEETHGHGA